MKKLALIFAALVVIPQLSQAGQQHTAKVVCASASPSANIANGNIESALKPINQAGRILSISAPVVVPASKSSQELNLICVSLIVAE